MELGRITIQGYRSIPYEKPLTLTINDGITFITGPNNVGKSNLLKLFYELKPSFNAFQNENTYQEGIRFNAGIPHYSFMNFFNQKSKSKKIKISLQNPLNFGLSFEFNEGITVTARLSPKSPNSINLMDSIKDIVFQSLYIPSFRFPYTSVNFELYDIGMGQALVNNINEYKLGNNLQMKLAFDEFESEVGNLLQFEKFQILPNSNNTGIEIRNEHGFFTLPDLGAGISHIIVCLLNVFIKKPAYVLIDEPENGLHPKLQRDFMQLLASKSTYGILATTHSLGLAMSVGDTIYSMTKDEQGYVHLRDFQEVSKFEFLERLGEMNYSSFSEIGGNHILLVEGNKDIKFFREVLSKYNISDYFIIIDLGGSISDLVFEKLSEIKRLNPLSINVIVDSDRTQPSQDLKPEIHKFLTECNKLDINAIATEYNATENYINQFSLNKVYSSKQFTALDSYEVFSQRSGENKWSKSDNWKMARVMERSDFDSTDLGAFFNKLRTKVQSGRG